MIAFENIIAIVLAFSIVTVSPGPANIAVAAVSMGTGRKQGLRFGFGLSLGLAFWGIVAATGMGAVLQSANQFLIALKILGGLYLLWLALQAGRSAMKKTEDLTSSTHQSHWFLRGLVLNLSNPKAVFAWMAALSMGLGNDGQISILVGATLIENPGAIIPH